MRESERKSDLQQALRVCLLRVLWWVGGKEKETRSAGASQKRRVTWSKVQLRVLIIHAVFLSSSPHSSRNTQQQRAYTALSTRPRRAAPAIMAPARIRGVPDSPSSLGEDSTSPLLHLVHTPFWLLEGSSSHSTSDASSSLGVPSYYDSSACTASYVPLGCALSTAAGLIVARTLAPSTLELSSLPVPGEASAPTPLRLHFPAPLLPHPCLRIDAHGNLHILAATSAALHRVTLPPSALGALGMGDVAPQPLLELKDEWCFEVALENAHRVCVVDEARIVVASSAGIALMQQRIDASGEFISELTCRQRRRANLIDLCSFRTQTTGGRSRSARTRSCASCRASSRVPRLRLPRNRAPARVPLPPTTPQHWPCARTLSRTSCLR